MKRNNILAVILCLVAGVLFVIGQNWLGTLNLVLAGVIASRSPHEVRRWVKKGHVQDENRHKTRDNDRKS